ncbi:molybdate ABC transporter substrate-binding protein [Palleronia sediminis]|uniref:Molybdate ABC transporter substrate-binding protein n=1 Tax=Palleronia sediminis TaxID=2547833 RepID=A0A4R6ALV4_9RHOB|nr:molybdate ABC transporter substrate-binding protein [Palleronia sediminis]TDL84342.1 molybdate ABC transporter substrate-binding protein [Palleronia sediminis]
MALALGAAAARAETVTVFAAASLKTALDEIAPGFEAATGHDLRLSYAGSSALARQIEACAPADIFISANPDWMDRLDAAGLLAAGTRADLLTNRLVLVAHGAEAAPLALGPRIGARLGEGRLAMALVDAVPAGIYGRAALRSLGLWDDLAPRVAQADNVRAALLLVARGAAPLGIVYETDALSEPRVSVVATFPEDSHPPILYPAAALEGRDGPAARAFLAHLSGEQAGAVFARLGFGRPGG